MAAAAPAIGAVATLIGAGAAVHTATQGKPKIKPKAAVGDMTNERSRVDRLKRMQEAAQSGRAGTVLTGQGSDQLG